MAIPSLYQSFLEKLSEKKFGMVIFWPFQIYASLLRKNCQKKIEKIFSDNFSVPITLIECDGLESNEICTFLDFYSESGTVIFGHFEFIPVILGKIARKIWNGLFGHSNFIPVFLGKIVRKNLEQLFLAVPNLF